MNLFLLDLNPKKCALYHCDKHVVKMILEIVQMLYSAWGMLEGADGKWRETAPEKSYKMTHTKHPISIWIRNGLENYQMAVEVCKELCKEYTRRYEKIHKCEVHLDWLAANPPTSIPHVPLSQMPQAMPEHYKVNNLTGTMEDSVQAYRNYYTGDKLRFAKYKNAEWPAWLPQPTDEEQKKLQTKFKKDQEDLKASKRKRTPKKAKEDEKPKSALTSRRKKVTKEETIVEVTTSTVIEGQDEGLDHDEFMDQAIRNLNTTTTTTTTTTIEMEESTEVQTMSKRQRITRSQVKKLTSNAD